MDKALKKRHVFGFVAIGILVTLIILASIVLLAVYSQKVTLTFYVNESGEMLEGTLYQGNIELGKVKEGKIDLVWQDFYPGEISFFIEGIETPFLFDLAIDSINYGSQEYYLQQYQIDDVSKGIEDYNLDRENELIVQKINEKRSANGAITLKVDSRLEEIADDFVKEYILGELDPVNIEIETLSLKLAQKKAFFVRIGDFWTYYDINSTMILSDYFVEAITEESSWFKELIESPYTNIGVVTRCDENKHCFTLALFSQNVLFFGDSLKYNYIQRHEPYYFIESNGHAIDYESNVSVSFSSTESMRVFLVPFPEDFEKIRTRDNVNEIFKTVSSKFQRNVTIKPNNIFVLDANSKATTYTLNISEIFN